MVLPIYSLTDEALAYMIDEKERGRPMSEKWARRLKTVVQFILNPRLLLCFGIGWMITNGWSYILLGLGTWLNIPWMIAVAGAYLAFLWFPFSPEKLLTVAIAIFLLRRLFPNDQKTLAVLTEMKMKIMEIVKKRKENK